jgi:hypothetical protein
MCGLNKLFYASAASKRDNNIPSPSKHSQIFGEYTTTAVESILQEKPQQIEEEATMPIKNMMAQQDGNDDPPSPSSSENQCEEEMRGVIAALQQATPASVNFPQKVSSLRIYDSYYSDEVIYQHTLFCISTLPCIIHS